jgi:hypothetical protein
MRLLEASMSETNATTVNAPTLAERIAEAMSEAGEVTKSATNTEQKYKYATAEAILGAIRGPLFARGVLLAPDLENVEEQEITSSRGTKGTRAIAHVTFTFTDGRESLVCRWRGEGQDYGDKAYGKAYTNAIKTFIRSAWLLPTEHDDPEASPSGDRMASDDPSPAALNELKRQYKRHQPMPSSTLAACLLSVGATGIKAEDLETGAWATKVNRQQVSALIDLFKSGTLPTGESDVPADADDFKAPADANPDEFFEAAK